MGILITAITGDNHIPMMGGDISPTKIFLDRMVHFRQKTGCRPPRAVVKESQSQLRRAENATGPEIELGGQLLDS
jgi:hypothetical protein